MGNSNKYIFEKFDDGLNYGAADLIRIDKILNFVGKRKTILDLGCADGYLSERILKKGNKVIGVDLSCKALIKAKKRGIETIKADLAQNLPFRDCSFDEVAATEIIEHIADTDGFLKEIHRVLRFDGSLILSTSNLVSLGRRFSYLLGKSGYHEASYTVPVNAAGHLRYFNKELLFNLLIKHKFSIKAFTSDIVNFSFDTNSGFRSERLANIFPTLGRSLIVKAVKIV